MALHTIKRRKTDSFSDNGIPEFASRNPRKSRIKSKTAKNSGPVWDTKYASTRPFTTSALVSISSLREIQVEKMLAKMRPGYGRRTVKAEDALRKIKRIIEEIPEMDAIPVGFYITDSRHI